jgi:hypothetical protein
MNTRRRAATWAVSGGSERGNRTVTASAHGGPRVGVVGAGICLRYPRQPLARCEKKLTISETQVCMSCPAPDGLEMIQTTIRITMIQPSIFPIKLFPP